MQNEHAAGYLWAGRSCIQLVDLQAAALEATANAAMITNQLGTIIWVNSAFERLTGYRHSEIVGQNTRALKSDRNSRIVYEQMWQTILGGRTWRGELINRRKDGSLYDEEMTVTPVQDGLGEITHFVAIKQNITERKRAEQETLFKNALLEAQAETSIDGILAVDESNHIVLANKQFGLQFEIPDEVLSTRDELIVRKHITDKVADPDAFIQKLEYLNGHPDEKSRDELRFKNGKVFDRYSAPLVDSRGQHRGRIWYFRDITERNLLRIQLLQAQKLESVGQLAAGIAHEINTPIQFVGDNARFVQNSFGASMELIDRYDQLCEQFSHRDTDTELKEQLKKARDKADWEYVRNEVPRALNEMLEGVDRVAKIVRSMKEFSHVDRNADKAPADLNKAMESTLVVANNELKSVAKVEADYGELPLVSCHLGDLNQVFLNLLVNAAHAIADVVKEPGSLGLIGVRTRQDGEWVEIAVSDTGTGIPEGIRDKVFDPFFTTKEVGRGSGQGLALARAIVVEKHGGKLTFETEIGKGTTFRIRLPFHSN